MNKKNWDSLIEKYSLKDIFNSMDFSEAMHLSECMFYENMDNDEIQQFALNLAFEIRDHYKNEWEDDWKNDVFLGLLCSLLWRYDERYICYKRAYDKLSDPSESLLLMLAGCNSAPGTPPISDETAEMYLRKAIEKKITYEGAIMMRALYRNKKDPKMEEHWDRITNELLEKNIHSESIIPDVLKKEGDFHPLS